MTEPTEDQVLLKATQLARDEGRLRLWGSEYDQLRMARGQIADDTLRAEFLNRARVVKAREDLTSVAQLLGRRAKDLCRAALDAQP